MDLGGFFRGLDFLVDKFTCVLFLSNGRTLSSWVRLGVHSLGLGLG